jgi:hypothetical protein
MVDLYSMHYKQHGAHLEDVCVFRQLCTETRKTQQPIRIKQEQVLLWPVWPTTTIRYLYYINEWTGIPGGGHQVVRDRYERLSWDRIPMLHVLLEYISNDYSRYQILEVNVKQSAFAIIERFLLLKRHCTSTLLYAIRGNRSIYSHQWTLNTNLSRVHIISSTVVIITTT